MAVADTLQELATDIQNAYTAINNRDGVLPANKNTNNLDTAIDSINDLAKLLNRQLVTVDIKQQVDLYELSVMRSQPNLVSVRIRNGKNTIGQQQFASDTKLEIVDIAGTTDRFNNLVFNYDTKLKTLVLRRTSSIFTMYGTTTFNSTPFRDGTGGTVYVPYTLVSTYSTATNWVALESTTFASIQENLIALNTAGVDITDYYEIVTELPTTDISTTKVYLIETQTEGTYEQWFYGSGSWVQLADITL